MSVNVTSANTLTPFTINFGKTMSKPPTVLVSPNNVNVDRLIYGSSTTTTCPCNIRALVASTYWISWVAIN